jgi:hypothetical protein
MNADTETLINELSSALADLVEVAQQGQASSKQIAAALADMRDALKAQKPDDSTQALCDAIRAIKPQVTVNVEPTPIVVNVERGAFKMEFKYDSHDRIVGATITPAVKP